ncbi:hypothetical protein A9G07_06655 [Gilliamella sp. wkB72]|nr:hypothetical protein A9G07_06655 [Gilliamella apicola]
MAPSINNPTLNLKGFCGVLYQKKVEEWGFWGSKFCFEILSQINNSALTVALFSSCVFPSKKVEERGFWGSKFCFEILSQINNSALNCGAF